MRLRRRTDRRAGESRGLCELPPIDAVDSRRGETWTRHVVTERTGRGQAAPTATLWPWTARSATLPRVPDEDRIAVPQAVVARPAVHDHRPRSRRQPLVPWRHRLEPSG